MMIVVIIMMIITIIIIINRKLCGNLGKVRKIRVKSLENASVDGGWKRIERMESMDSYRIIIF